MKKKIKLVSISDIISRNIPLIFFALILWNINCVAQPYPLTHPTSDPSPWRGLYINKFVNQATPANEILGVAPRDLEALKFAKDNNFKRLDLTHLDEIFPGHLTDQTPSGNTYENDLCSFMTDARERYCIEQISAVAAANNFFVEFNDWNTLHFTSPYDFSTSSIPGINTFGSSFSYVQNTYTTSDGSIALRSEMMKFFLRLLDYNYRHAPQGLGVVVHPCRFDNFTIEYEWWNTLDWNFIHDLLLDLNTLQYNTNHAFNIHLYTLIRDFTDIGGTAHSAQQIADFIDPLVDKIYLTDYPNTQQAGTSNIPDDFWNLNYFRWGMNAFGNNSTPNTIITPLFNCLQNNEGIHDWLVDPAHPEHTLFTAEQRFWTDKSISTNSVLIGDNILTHGSYQWIYYTYFPMITSHWTYPYCSNNEVFYVQNQSLACPATNTITACTGDNLLFKYISNYETNVTCEWNFGDGTPIITGAPGDQSHIYLQPGTYTATCHLTFPSSLYPNSQSACEYIDFQRTVVVTGAGIAAAGPTTFCQGGSVQLTASTGTSYYWTTPSGSHFTSQVINANENGTYIVAVANSGGCTSSTPGISIIINPLPTPNVGPLTNVSCFGGNNGTATAVGNGGTPPYVSYAWNTIPVQNNAQATNLTIGTYICTVTDNKSCIGTVSATITQPTQINITFQNISNPCIGGSSGSVTAVASGGTPSYSYSWNTVPVQNSAQATGLTAGTYIVTVTDGNGCITSASYSLTENSSCCGNPSSQIIPAPGNIPNTTYSNNLNLSFPATVSSGTVTFSDLDLSIAAGVTITINSGATLRIEANSHLHACGDMWAGIINNGTLIVDNSTIEDAVNAITTSSGNQIQITGATFDHNYTSLKIENGNFTSSFIHSTIFRCSGGYSLKVPYLGQRTLHQIRISNADVTIGDPTYLNNDFSGSDIGIQMENLFSNGVSVYNNYFHNFDINTQNSNSSGMAIYSTKMKFTLGASGGGRSNNFYDNYLGVLFTSCSAPTIEHNSFDNNAGGIFGMFNFGATMEINHNTMSNMMQGISMIWNPKSNINIRENTIQNVISSSFLGSGISIGESDFFGSNNGTYLWRNVIHSEGNYGIYLNNLAHSKIIENRVYLDQSTVNSSDIAIGIRIDNSDNNYLSCNEVDNKASTDPANKYGISVYDYFKQTMESNTTNGTAFGIQLISNCEGSYYLANSIQNHTEDGLLIGDINNYVNTYVEPLVTYNSELPGNLWNNNLWDTHNYYQTYAPQLWTKNGSGNPDYPRYNTESGGGPIITPYVQSSLNLHQPLTCNIPVVEVGTESESKFNVLIAEQIASSQLQTFSQDIVSEWKAKTALYQSLKEDPSQIANSAILAQFYNATSNGNIGKLTDIKQFLKDSQDSIVQSDSALKANLEQNAKSLNDGLIPEILPELNEKIVTDVYLNTVARNNFHFESQYVSDLLSVGLQCIYEGGPAVLKARNLLHSQYPFLLFNDYDLCNNTSFRKSGEKPTQSSLSQSDLFVYPNPATNQLTCLFKNGSIVEITDLTGRVVLSEPIPENSLSLTIGISDLAQGSYVVVLKSEDGILKQTKLNVVH